MTDSPALPPLADVADVLALVPGADEETAAAMLDKASARFRSEARNPITLRACAKVLRPYGGKVRLPSWPVVTVDAVRALGTLTLLATGIGNTSAIRAALSWRAVR